MTAGASLFSQFCCSMGYSPRSATQNRRSPAIEALTRIGRVAVIRKVGASQKRCFRHGLLEVRNGVVPMPTIWEYLSFAFFVPTLAVGPISRYSVFRESLENP